MIELPSDVRDEIERAARAGAPDEICGVLAGSFDADHSRVTSHYPAENAAENSRTRYRLDPEEQLEIFDRLEERGEEIVGFYHSHPRGPLEPSETDAAWATWPDRSYLIVSLEDGSGSGDDGSSSAENRTAQVGSWRWREGGGDEAVETTANRAENEGCFERERVVLERG